ncbi:MFS transporter [Streptomyces glaucosporus]|uniref:MFS transporter n=1 Tax=Streptomyces glaucosporus TaxID=284044 RepID=A0ABN3HZ51_9ACTN
MTHPHKAAAFLRREGRRLLGGFLLFLLSSFGQTFFVSLFADDVRGRHGLTHGSYGALYMAATLLGAVALTRTGHLVDRHPARRVVLVSVPLLALGAVAMACSADLLTLFGALVLLRLFGQGMMTHTAFTVLGRWFTRQRGRAVSLAALGLNAGEAALPALAVALAGAAGWQSVWWAAGAVVIVVGAAVAALFRTERAPHPAAGSPDPAEPAAGWTRAEVLRDRCFYPLLLATAAPALIGNTVFFHQAHLAGTRGWSLEVLASAFPLYAVLTVLCSVAGGVLLDRFTALVLLPVFLLPLGGGLLLLGTVTDPWSVFAFMALYGVTNGLSLSLFGAVWPEVYGTRHLGAIRSVVVAVLVFASALGPGAGGLLLDAGVGQPVQLVALGGYCLAASALVVPVTRRLRARATAAAH